ncbi:hypothetical protein HG530_004910 [Fusarium avenaceum]|nr:hypothetical protein HG530_004910 [Fusarium avenaceum]
MATLYRLTNSDVGPHLFTTARQNLFREHRQRGSNNSERRIQEFSVNFLDVLCFNNTIDLFENKLEILLVLRCVFIRFKIEAKDLEGKPENCLVSILVQPRSHKSKESQSPLLVSLEENLFEKSRSCKLTLFAVIVG